MDSQINKRSWLATSVTCIEHNHMETTTKQLLMRGQGVEMQSAVYLEEQGVV
jgi:hypothetical protein